MAPYQQVQREIQPHEAAALASGVEQVAGEVALLAQRVEQVGRNLDQDWVGRAKTNFFSQFNHVPGKLDRLEQDLSGKARQLRVLKVIITVLEWFDDLGGGGN